MLNFIKEASKPQLKALILDGKNVEIDEQSEEIINDRFKLIEQKIKIPIKHPGMLEVPEGKDVEKLPLEHFKKLVVKKGFAEISKSLINLKVWMKKTKPEISKWADDTQEKLAAWVEKERETKPDFAD